MKRPRTLLLSFVLLASGAIHAHAQCTTNSGPCVFPPGSCAYVLSGAGSGYFGGHKLDLFDFESSTDCAALPGNGVSDVQTVHATAVLRWTPGGGSPVIAGGPVVLTIHLVGGPPVDPRPVSLELLALDLSGVSIPGGVLARESPTRASVGQGTVHEGPPGTYLINSFFDIFTEISLDGGQSWVPSVDSQHLALSQGPPLPARPSTWGAVKAIYR
jgi:hypothetical protein